MERKGTNVMNPLRIQELLLRASHRLEQVIAAVILLVVTFRMAVLCWETVRIIWEDPGSFSLGDFLAKALLLVMGIEFVKLLVLHTAAAVLHVLLFTLVRQMIVTHTGALDTLLGVAAVAAVFAVRKFLSTQEDQPNTPHQ